MDGGDLRGQATSLVQRGKACSAGLSHDAMQSSPQADCALWHGARTGDQEKFCCLPAWWIQVQSSAGASDKII